MPTPETVAPSIPYDRIRAVEWLDGHIRLIDQRLLPGSEVERRCHASAEVADAIGTLAVRGAPAIGIAAAL